MIIYPTDSILSIGIAVKKLGVSPQLLKKYEREGLMIAEKTESAHRLYSERDLEWIDFLHHQIMDNKMKVAGLRLLLALIPCWDIQSKCSSADCNNCEAYKNYNVICWTIEDQGSRLCRENSCRDCVVYNYAVNQTILKKCTLLLKVIEKIFNYLLYLIPTRVFCTNGQVLTVPSR